MSENKKAGFIATCFASVCLTLSGCASLTSPTKEECETATSDDIKNTCDLKEQSKDLNSITRGLGRF